MKTILITPGDEITRSSEDAISYYMRASEFVSRDNIESHELRYNGQDVAEELNVYIDKNNITACLFYAVEVSVVIKTCQNLTKTVRIAYVAEPKALAKFFLAGVDGAALLKSVYYSDDFLREKILEFLHR